MTHPSPKPMVLNKGLDHITQERLISDPDARNAFNSGVSAFDADVMYSDEWPDAKLSGWLYAESHPLKKG